MLGHKQSRSISWTLLKGSPSLLKQARHKDAAQAWIDSVSDAALSKQAAEALVAELGSSILLRPQSFSPIKLPHQEVFLDLRWRRLGIRYWLGGLDRACFRRRHQRVCL